MEQVKDTQLDTGDKSLASDTTKAIPATSTDADIKRYEQALEDLRSGKITSLEFKNIVDSIQNPPEVFQ